MNTSLPRMFSLKRADTSPSSKRETSASPSGTLSLSQIDLASVMLALPAKIRHGSTSGYLLKALNDRSRGPKPPPQRDDGVRSVHDGRRSWRAGSPHARRTRRPGMAGAGGFEPPDAG